MRVYALLNVLAALFVCLLGAAPLAAQAPAEDPRDQEARALFEAGRLAMGDGRYEDALTHFERAHALSQRPAMLFNIGTVAERLRLHERALSAYEQYLELLPEAENRPEVQRRIELLRADVERARDDAAAASSQKASEDERERPRWWKSYWLWGAVGAVAVGVGVGLLVASSDSGAETEAPITGHAGRVTYTLTTHF